MTSSEALSLTQGSPEWREARVGYVTASRMADVIAMKKSRGKTPKAPEELAARANYRAEIISERLTGIPYPQFVSREMEWGAAQEPFARAAYELAKDVLVETVGFVLHWTIPNFGCSPDGLVGDEGLIQIKCPNTSTHLAWMLAGTVPVEHAPQMIAELACHPERKWSDFVSYDPRLPKHLELFVARMPRNDNLVALVEREVVTFNRQIEEVLASLPQAQPLAEVLDWPKDDEVEL